MKKFLLLIILFAAACNTVKKQQRNAEAFYRSYPEKLAKECAEKFPVDTIYKHGATIVKSDTITVKGDSISCPPYINAKGDTVFVKVKCPDNKIIHDTIIRIDTIVKANTALAVYLGYQKDSLQNELIKVTTLKDIAEKHAKTRLWILIGICVLAVAGIILKLKKFI